MRDTNQETQLTGPDFLGLAAKYEIPLYVLAAMVRLHPAHLSKVLHGRAPLSDDLARRLVEALEELR